MFSILKNTYITIQTIKDGDNETLTGAGVDMQGYDSVAFVATCLKGNVGTPTIKAQQDTDLAFGTATDLLGTSVAFATTSGADAVTCLEIHNPRERYVRPIITVPDWNAVAMSCIAIQFNAKDMPKTNSGELHIAPAEGTA